ncbi:ArsR family transcriptional regulator [Cytophagales bacterium LB-30]|uniref:ArsR family transcriptional regulator n=1 Tax=Shiella aurantiaca TaxID=3058365 RepID=A0ABT8F8A3_9BACT|nr:ArsR family transcriptional regulator [Shiella aurantiaca]MDN4166609.1 ArsR family transcriptional regulator [Shiella aurantiaca]
MLDTLITSKTRIKLLLKFFLNSSTQGYLRNLESEFGDSTNAIRLELNKFEQAGMLASTTEGNKKIFKANTEHPLFPEIQALVRKYIGLDRIIEQVIGRVGDLQLVCLVGDYARGIDSGKMEVVLVGENLNADYLDKMSTKAQEIIHRKVHYTTLSPAAFSDKNYPDSHCLVLWES